MLFLGLSPLGDLVVLRGSPELSHFIMEEANSRGFARLA